MRVKIKKIYLSTLFLLSTSTSSCRSAFRLRSPLEPCITARWQGDPVGYSLTHSHLQEGPYFNLFDKKYFLSHMLPEKEIAYRYIPNQSVSGAQLSLLIENLLKEVHQGKSLYTDFEVLKQRDFNRRDQTGLIIAKFKNYPFVLKIFIETPKSFVEPLSKGFETTGLFLLGGGITRHLTGFTRIKNLERLKKKVTASTEWSNKVDFPRKWYWLPKNAQWLEISGKNIGPEGQRTVYIPAVYALICDYIEVERMFGLSNKHDRTTAMNLSNFLKQEIDPHINNYAIEKGTNKIVPIDTEHFPTMVGYDKPPTCDNYVEWYNRLGLKIIKDSLGRSKPERRRIQARRHWPMGPFE